MDANEERLATRRELGQLAWAVLFIDGIAIGIGLLANKYVDGARWVGLGLAIWVTIAFLVLVSGNLLVVSLARRWRGGPRGKTR